MVCPSVIVRGHAVDGLAGYEVRMCNPDVIRYRCCCCPDVSVGIQVLAFKYYPGSVRYLERFSY